jgi:hypothetical protein
MFDIVASYDDELTLRIKREDINHAQSRRPASRSARRPQPMRENEPIEAIKHANGYDEDHHAAQRLQRAAISGDKIA